MVDNEICGFFINDTLNIKREAKKLMFNYASNISIRFSNMF